jgi:RNA polymerase sigma factor (sigma-70 family)
MLKIEELTRVYGLTYTKAEHDIIADAYLMVLENSSKAAPSEAMTAVEVDKKDVYECYCKLKRAARRRRKKEVYVDNIEIVAALSDARCSRKSSYGDFSEQNEYPLRPEDILNRILEAERVTFVNYLLSGLGKKKRLLPWKYYCKGLTLNKIAKEDQCSAETVRRGIKSSIEKLHATVKRKGLEYNDFTRF